MLTVSWSWDKRSHSAWNILSRNWAFSPQAEEQWEQAYARLERWHPKPGVTASITVLWNIYTVRHAFHKTGKKNFWCINEFVAFPLYWLANTKLIFKCLQTVKLFSCSRSLLIAPRHYSWLATKKLTSVGGFWTLKGFPLFYFYQASEACKSTMNCCSIFLLTFLEFVFSGSVTLLA